MQSIVKPKQRYSWLVLSGLLPLLLCFIFSFIEARQTVKRQLELTAAMLLTQADYVSDLAWTMNGRLQQFSHSQCAEVKTRLQQIGTLSPYFRSVGLARNDNIFCSSAFGERQGTLEHMIRRPLPAARGGQWSLSIAGSAGVHERPAVLFMQESADGSGSYALVDGQYLSDVMRAAGSQQGYRIALRFGDGYRIISDEGPRQQSGDWGNLWGHRSYSANSQRYPISITISAPHSAALRSWRQVLLTFLPMALILSLLFIALTRSWLQRRSAFRDEIHRAIAHGEFSAHYQPVLNLAAGSCYGVEVLMRWQRADGSWVRPDVFIAAAEAEGMIVPLTRHLLDIIVRDSVSWTLPAGFHLGVNVAADHLQHADFVSDIRTFAAALAHLAPVITLELTERSLISDGESVARKLAELRNEGIRIAIDDFGTGHCSFSYLQTFPLDYLKIDQGFVRTIESVDGATPVLDAIIHLAQRLRLDVVAEGIENALQQSYLQNHGVIFIQGYHYARPMDSVALMRWMSLQAKKTAPHPA